jgi:hypothetical protein
MLGTAACYHRDKVGSSNDDAHIDKFMLHTGVFRTHSVFVGSLFFISPSPVRAMAVRKCSKCCRLVFISWTCAFRAGGDASIFFSVPIETEKRNSCLASMGLLFLNLTAHPLLGEEGSTSPPRWLRTAARNVVKGEVKSPQVLVEAARA